MTRVSWSLMVFLAILRRGNENSYLELDVVLRVKEARNAIANKNS